jgi:hypothetical protein
MERATVHLKKALAVGYTEFWVRYILAWHIPSRRIVAARHDVHRAAALRPESVGISVLGG